MIHDTWSESKGEEDRGDTSATETPVEAETRTAFPPKDLPSSILQDIESLSFLHDLESSSDTFADGRTATDSSPTFSVSTISDFTPTDFGDDIGENGGEQIPTRHKAFCLEDGNTEIMCGHTIFRIHSPIVSFSSPSLREILSPSTLLDAPMPGGCPRIPLTDSADDFAVLLEMIYTPGYVPSPQRGFC